MPYVDGFIVAVPKKNLAAYAALSKKAGKLWREYGALDYREWLAEALADDIAELHGEGRDVLVVSSGAIALGRTVLDCRAGALKLEESQAAAAVGQIALARTWSEVLGASRHHRRADPADARRHRGAPPLPQRPRHASQRCSS